MTIAGCFPDGFYKNNQVKEYKTMCQFKSAICLKDRVFVPDYDSHNKMLEELHIEDDFVHASKVFVRVELVPEDGDKTSDVDEWKLNVDQDVLPDWWDENDCLPRIKAAVKAWCDIHILRNGTHIVRDGIWYVYGSAMVIAFGSARVIAFNDVKVQAYSSTSVTACDSASVEAFDNASVEAFDNASVELPRCFQTLKPVLLHDKAICINYKDHTIQSPAKRL